MNFGTLGGIIAMFAMFVLSILIPGGSLAQFYDLPAILIVILGSTACIVAAYPLEQVLKIPTYIRVIMRKSNIDYVGIIHSIITLGEIARKEGLLSLEDKMMDLDDNFLKKGLQMAVDGVDEEIVKRSLNIDIDQMVVRHTSASLMFETWAILSPSFGMIATLTGLVMMLGNISDINSVGPGMSAALCGTFFGAIFGYAIMTPIAKKLEAINEEEVLKQEIIIEGVLSIIHGESPQLLEDKLISFLSPTVRKQIVVPKD